LVFLALTLVCINKIMQTHLTYRNGLVATINKYSPYLNYAVTLTLKQRATIRVKRFDNWDGEFNEFSVKLTEDIALNTLNYFNARLTHYAYGKDARRTATKHYAQPLIISTIEGVASNKRIHIHAAIGNLPTKYLYEANEWISKAWADCDFAHKQIKINKLTDCYGWLDYMAKETSVGNLDAICIDSIKQPQSIQQLVGA
jgi:hypothetical protein